MWICHRFVRLFEFSSLLWMVTSPTQIVPRIFIKNEPFRFPFPLDNTMLPEKYEQYDIIGEKEC